jgi:hypothetical protein
MCLKVSRKHLHIPEVVSDATQMPSVTYCGSSKWGPISAIAARKLFGEVHSIAHRSSVAARKDSSTVLECLDKQLTGGSDCAQRYFIVKQAIKRPLCLAQAVPNVFIHKHT